MKTDVLIHLDKINLIKQQQSILENITFKIHRNEIVTVL